MIYHDFHFLILSYHFMVIEGNTHIPKKTHQNEIKQYSGEFFHYTTSYPNQITIRFATNGINFLLSTTLFSITVSFFTSINGCSTKYHGQSLFM